MAFNDAPTERDIADFLATRGLRQKAKRSVREALDADYLTGSLPSATIEGEVPRGRVGGKAITMWRRAAIVLIVMSIGAGIGAVGQYSISNRHLDLKMVEMAEMTIEKLRFLRAPGSPKP